MDIHPSIYGHSSIYQLIINFIILRLQLAAQLTIVGDFHPSQYQICLNACKRVREQGDDEVKLTLNERRKKEFDCDNNVRDEEDKDDLNHRVIDDDDEEEAELQYEPSISRRLVVDHLDRVAHQ